MATVYLAQDLRHNRRVAVKVLRPELAAVIGADRFLTEITTTAKLQRPTPGAGQLVVVENWFEELRRKMRPENR